MPTPERNCWTRRQAMAALAVFAAGGALADSRDGAKFMFADQARSFAARGQKSLSLLIPMGSSENIMPIAREFTGLTGVRIDVEEAEVRDIGTTLLIQQLQGQRHFDIALPPTYEIPDLVASQALIALDDIEGFELARRQSLEALYTNGDSFDGRTYGHQTDGDVYLMICNESLLNDPDISNSYAHAYGQPLETPLSWQDFDRQIRFFNTHLDIPGAVLFRGNGGVEWEFWLRLHAKGIWPLSADFEPQIDSEQGQEVLEEMIAIQPFIISLTDNRNFGRAWQAYQDTGAYASFGWGGTQKIFRHAHPGRPTGYRFAPIPGGASPGSPQALSYFNWGWSYTLVAGTECPELALSFVNFAVTPEVSTEAVRQSGGFFDPFRSEHYEDAAIREIYGAAFLQVHKTALTNAIPDFYIANRGAYFETLGAWLELALQGTVRPEVALRNAADHWRLLGDDTQRGDQAARWRQLRSKYPRHVASRLRDLPV